MENPTAVPQATGSRIAAAGFEKRKLGRVKEGMYDVILEAAMRLRIYKRCSDEDDEVVCHSKDILRCKVGLGST
jgi:hypothetical protein